jgi:hypothetical protein
MGKPETGVNTFFCAQYINIGTGGADLSSSFFLPRMVGWGRAAEMCMTKDAFNAALNGSSLEDANRMEDRNQALIIANAITEGAKDLG